MNNELKIIANENTFESWLLSWSNDPIPSVSITIIFMSVPSYDVHYNGVPHIHNPLVHGFIEFPTPNPFYLFKISLFIKYDFPVLYNPTTEIILIGCLIFLIISIASLLILISYVSNVIKGIGSSLNIIIF